MRTAATDDRYGALDPRQPKHSRWYHDEKKDEYADQTRDDNQGDPQVHHEVRFFASKLDDEIPTSFKCQCRFWLAVCTGLIVVSLLLTLRSYYGNKHPAGGSFVDNLEYTVDSGVYDYIVVGGGPSGIMVAYKLAKQLQNAKVLLLESGTAAQSAVLKAIGKGVSRQDEYWNMFDIPLMWSGVASSQGRLMNMQDGDFSVISPDSWSSHHWPIPLTLLGRGLGGSGLHNAMIYVRSLPSDFERWNMTGWTWDHILPLYRDLEMFLDDPWGDDTILPKPTINSTTKVSGQRKYPWRGTAGPVVTVPAGPAVDAVAPLFLESALAIGIPEAAPGFNHPDAASRVGAGYYEFNIRNGVRGSVAEALLGDGSKPPSNLVIRTGATVTRVLLRASKRATGVEYVDGDTGNVHHVMLTAVKDRKAEVILASGAIMTPQLLSNSGIGENGSVAKLPGVGKNLQDHPAVAMTFSIAPELAESATSVYTVADEMQDYFIAVTELEKNRLRFGMANMSSLLSLRRITSRLGTLATAGFSAGAFLRSPYGALEDSDGDGAPDIQLTVFPRVIEPHVTRKERNQDKTASRSSAMLVTVALLQAEARYQVYPATYEMSARVWDSNPQGPAALTGMPLTAEIRYPLPSIQLPWNSTEYLTDRDVLRLAWGMEQVRRILNTPPLATMTGGELFPGSHITDTALEDHVRVHNMPNSHWVGTTKMGTDDDPMAVVDEELRVRGGVQGLRIVDSGVFPSIPNGNTHSTVCVVASRAADLIIKGRRPRRRHILQ